MNFERITNNGHPVYCRALELYKISFPSHEQRERLSQEAILSDSDYHFTLVNDESVFVGIVLYWETDHFIYIEHLCMLPEMRNKSYGQKILSLLEEREKTIILEIDPPVDDTSKRRKGFYERCGFVENEYQHVHPPYHSGNDGHKLAIMTYPKEISRESYEIFNKYLHNRIMDRAFTTVKLGPIVIDCGIGQAELY